MKLDTTNHDHIEAVARVLYERTMLDRSCANPQKFGGWKEWDALDYPIQRSWLNGAREFLTDLGDVLSSTATEGTGDE